MAKFFRHDYLNEYRANAIYPEYSQGGKIVERSDPEWKRIFDIIHSNKGKTFVPDSDGSPKLMYEGYGLKRFTGKYDIGQAQKTFTQQMKTNHDELELN